VEDHNSRVRAGRGVNYGCDEPPCQRRSASQTRETGDAEIKRRPRAESYGPRITERDLRHGVVQCNHCNCSPFHSARFECVKRHSGMLCAYLIFVGAMKYFGGHMAKMIEFYIPQSFRKVSRWFPPAERGKVLAFPLVERKSA
jgi:hypothetical protein